MQQSQLELYLISKGISVVTEKKSGRGKILSKCPWCEKESWTNNEHCGLITNGNIQYVHCFVCGESGGLAKIKKHYGDWKEYYDKEDHIHILRDKTGNHVATWVNTSKTTDAVDTDHNMKISDDIIQRSSAFLFADHEISKNALNYLTKQRQFSIEALKRWHIGLVVRAKCADSNCDYYGVLGHDKKCAKCSGKIKNYRYFISIPFFDSDGELMNIKYRSVPPTEKAFEREKGGVTLLFGLDHIDFSKPVMVTEAELDAIAAWQMGFKNVLSLGGATNWNDSFQKMFVSAPEIYLCMDNDKAGKKATVQISESLGKFRCKVVKLPVKDAAEYLEAGNGKEDWRQVVKNAISSSVPIWLKSIDIYPDLKQIVDMGDEAKGISTGWRDVDSLIGGIRTEELSIVTSDTGSGKSLWTNELAMNLAKQDVPVAVCSFEIMPKATLQRSVSQIAQKSYWELVGSELDESRTGKSLLEISVGILNDLPIYFLGINGEIQLDKLLGMLRWGIVRFGLKFIVLDHLHYFLPGMGSRNERFIIDSSARRLNQSCKEWDIHEMLVVHPSKHDSSKPWGVRSGPNDLKGSSGLKQEAHNIFSIYRPRGLEAAMKESGAKGEGAAEVRLWKTRSIFGEEGVCWQGFKKAGLHYFDINRETQKEYARIDNEAVARLRANQNAKSDNFLMSPDEINVIQQQESLGVTNDDPFGSAIS